MPGGESSEARDRTFIADEAIGELLFVCVGATDGSCKLPAAAADRKKILGITQEPGVAGKPVRVRTAGESELVASAAISDGDIVRPLIAGDKGKGETVAEPALAGDPPSAATVAARLDFIQEAAAQARETVTADNDRLTVELLHTVG